MFSRKWHSLMWTHSALLLFITRHLLIREWQGLAEADNELGVETVRVRPCRRGHCSPEWLIGQSGYVLQCECVTCYKNSLLWYFNEIIPKPSLCHVDLNCFCKSCISMQNMNKDADISCMGDVIWECEIVSINVREFVQMLMEISCKASWRLKD